MKRITLLFISILTVLLLVSCSGRLTPASDEQKETAVENGTVELICEDGKVVVKGSFENASATGKYTVNCIVVRDDNTEKPLNISKTFDLENGANSFELKLGISGKEQNVKVSVLADNGEAVCRAAEKTFKSLRILSIGNSFSVDAQQHLFGIAKDAGFDNIILGNLYVGGCSLEGHYSYYVNERASYTYYKNTTGEWTEKTDTTMLEGITDEEWDYITLQQSSPNSGLSETYEPYLSKLISAVKLHRTNPDAEFLWHMTWAYSADSTHQGYENYDSDQAKMYEAIVKATKDNIVSNPDISFVIPSGTAIQNARNTSLGDTLCRDGFHLDYNYGRYLAGLTWLHKITGLPIDGIDYIPEGAFDEETLEILKECAKNAVANPFEVAQ